MTILPEFQGIILDMDGLILDTEGSYFSAWQQAANSLGYHISDEFCISVSGLSFSVLDGKLLEHLGNAFPLADFYPLSGEFWQTEVESKGIAVKKGALELLILLQERDIPYCLATNSPEVNARECLEYAQVASYFPKMACRDHVPEPKPAADLFLQAAKHLQLPVESCLVVEDSLTGLLAAKNANAFSVLIPSLQVTPEMQGLAGVIMQDLSELSRLL